MSSNDVILLERKINDSRSETVGLAASLQETYFFAKHSLKEYSPSHDDLLSGIVDGNHDGGLDGIFILVNGNFIRDDSPVSGMGRDANVTFRIMQIKNTSGFSEAAVDKLIIHMPELLDYERDEKDLGKRFNNKIIEITRRFLRVISDLSMPNIRFVVEFASLKAADKPHPNVVSKSRNLDSTLKAAFSLSESEVNFLDAALVTQKTRLQPPNVKTLTLAENPISTDRGGYIGVVALPQYWTFISHETGDLDTSIFDANVRDYELESPVNIDIQKTLEAAEEDLDFWWLNNGVTVVADEMQLRGKNLDLVTPQVVNGLQTSYEVYKRGAMSEGALDPKQNILVKIVAPTKEDAKDRIIRATNSQTILGTSALRATDSVQRDIEEYLKGKGYYYERRKNHYRNNRLPLDRLVSIEQMGQAVIAVAAQLPHIARGHVSRIFDDDIYELAFTSNMDLNLFLKSIEIYRYCEKFLRKTESTRGEVENFVFHLSSITVIALTRKVQPSSQNVAEIKYMPSDELLNILLDIVRRVYAEVVRTKGYVLFDQVSKDESTSSKLAEAAHKYLQSSPRGTR